MGFWNKLFKQDEKVDYYHEGLELLRASKYHEALTSFRLALRESPNDVAVLQQIAIAYTRIGMTDEAIRTYRSVLAREPGSPGAHYGLAFLMLREGRDDHARTHLGAFLASPPDGPEAEAHIDHARRTLAELDGDGDGAPASAADEANGSPAAANEPQSAQDG